MSAAQYVKHYQTLADSLPGQHLPWLNAKRQLALGSFSASGFPSPREEEWKYINVSALEKKLFQPLLLSAREMVDAAWLGMHKLSDAWSLVLVDGRFNPGLSDLEGLPKGVIVTGLAEALEKYPEQVKSLLDTTLAHESHGFIVFNTAYFSDGAFIEIPASVALSKSLQILYVSTQNEALANTRSLVGLGANAEAKLIETFVGMAGVSYLTAAVTEIHLGEDAGLEHYKVQVESAKAYHFGGVYVSQERSSRFTQHNLSFGGMLARHEIHAQLSKDVECDFNGLFLATGRQHVDNHTLIHHAEPHGTSRETYRGVLADRARGIFQGRIVVYPKAQKTSAEMNNRNLLLSEDAEIDAKPQLEILADDVKCSHGVAVGQLDPESVFYLVSRGVDSETAKNMLTFAFANEMVEKIGLESLRGRVQQYLLDLFPQTGIRRDWL
jgi:Fe-S cluster assembly protein SufD